MHHEGLIRLLFLMLYYLSELQIMTFLEVFELGIFLFVCIISEGWYGEGGGRRVRDGEHMYTCGRFILIFGKTNKIM